MADAVLRLPVFLQRVDANFACRTNIWMENLGGKPAYSTHTRQVRTCTKAMRINEPHDMKTLTFWRSGREFFCEFELDPKVTAGIWCAICISETREAQRH